MAEETQTPAAAAAAAAEEVVVLKPVTEKELTPEPVPETVAAPEKVTKESTTTTTGVVEEVVEAEKQKAVVEEEKIEQSASFKEESNVVGELPDPQKKALDEFKHLIQEALNKHEFTAPPPPPPPVPAKEEEKAPEAPKEEAPKEEVKDEESKTVEEPKAPSETEKPTPVTETPADVVVVADVVEEVVVVDKDGTKTVEAIEETIIAAKIEVEEPTPSTKKADEEVTPGEETKVIEAKAEVPPPPPPQPEEVFIWGIPLLGDERSDTILLKFLRARDFKVKDAFTMIKNTVRWRKEFGIDALLEEDLGNELDKVVFMHGFDKEGHPVCYNVYGEFQNKELYQNTFADEEKRTKFLRSRIQFLEKSIRKLDFSASGICTIVQINDLKNSPGPSKRELRIATNQALQLLQDNYPEFVAKQIFINVPWWYLAFHRMISPFLTQRTKSKFVFAGPSKSAETLFKYIAPEQVPVQYGGLGKVGDHEFTVTDAVSEVIVKPASKYTFEIPVTETSVLVWELRVLGWDVSYGAEFVPSAEGSYTVIVSKTRKVSPTDEPVICDTFKVGEPGKVVVSIDNLSTKKKKLLYRSKTKPSSD